MSNPRRGLLLLVLTTCACLSGSGSQQGVAPPSSTEAAGEVDALSRSEREAAFPPEGFADKLSPTGCRDIYIEAVSPDGRIALTFAGPPLAKRAHESGRTQRWSHDLPCPEVEVQLLLGEHVAAGCNDVREFEAVVDRRWTATAGTVSLQVVPVGTRRPWGDTPARATLEMKDLVLQADDGGAPVTIPRIKFPDVYVGWQPG